MDDRNHQPLDDDELPLSLDDDMRALAALDRDMDIAMDVDGFAHNAVDDDDGSSDVFRPSAMLDRRMEEEFGGAFYSTCLQASELLEKDLLDGAGGFVDIEQMLLSESEEFLSVHFDDGIGGAGSGDSTQQQHRHLANGDGSGYTLQYQQHAVLRAELTARHFATTSVSGTGNSSDTTQQQRLVLLKQAITSSALPSSAIFNMPPKYFASGVAGSPQKRRAHRRTFGERTHAFAFGVSDHHAAVAVSRQQSAPPLSAVQQPAPVAAAATASPPPPLPVENLQQQQQPDPVVTTAAVAHGAIKHEALVASTGDCDVQAEPMDEDSAQNASALELERAQTPVRDVLFTGFRSISDDAEQLEREGVTLRTPLRRSLSSPATAGAAALGSCHERTPQPPPHVVTGRSMSPADAFDKVAAVMQVPKDSPGRLGTFEWRIGGSSSAQSQSSPQSQSLQRKSRLSLAMQLGSADELHAPLPAVAAMAVPSSAASSSDHHVAVTAGAGAALPPRYFRGGTTSPQKRRVHSSTFGAFARSFSFTGGSDTGTAPSDL